MMSTNSLEAARILLVDDNPTNLRVLSETLNQASWTILVATDGESAIEQVQYAQPNLILLDVMMPGIDGFATCQQLKANEKTEAIPIIFMTALSDTQDKVKGFELGAVDYITKPFQQEEVLSRVKLHLKLSQLTQHLEAQNTLLLEKITEKEVAEARLQQFMQELELRVEQRTAALSASLEQLQQAQLQLVQSEKMSALGNLVAGVAHEINNPIGFLQGNLSPAKTYIQELLGLVDLYQEKYPHPDQELQDELEVIDLDFLREDLDKLLNSFSVGIDRIRDISVSLRTFSRADREYKVLFDVREGLESTLLILKHRLKGNDLRPEIQIQRDYSEIPDIECFAGQLNQVFMNLLANAIDALDEASQKRSFEALKANPNVITVSTGLCPDQKQVTIAIQDNGVGMDDAVKQRIFDHLFTTKGVGQGTGLGLAIAKQIIVDKHAGSIEVESTPGQGTCFLLTLPIQAQVLASSPPLLVKG